MPNCIRIKRERLTFPRALRVDRDLIYLPFGMLFIEEHKAGPP